MWPFRWGSSRAGGKRPLGPLGEKIAVRCLRERGYKILARNYRCPVGEADIIALDRSTRSELGCETIAFVEVKTRSSEQYVDPESAVDVRKQRQLCRVARHYLAHHRAGGRAARFDVVSILIPQDGRRQVRHIIDAFPPP